MDATRSAATLEIPFASTHQSGSARGMVSPDAAPNVGGVVLPGLRVEANRWRQKCHSDGGGKRRL
ncbi:hypothetical protein A0H81_07988 [Grifola frondosa]|uniref:Uncharacterized protein n=1 Tax=Grifola frondosa TaxID=5627 RepID=A0A1C7M5Y9_GRIFR|nr:hypothetical protein A0H81_07988 [Grifola frondosa]